MNEVLDRVKRLIEGRFDVPPSHIRAASDLRDDLQLDSVDRVELVMAAEEMFSVEIGDEDMEGLRTVQDLADLVGRLLLRDGMGGKQI